MSLYNKVRPKTFDEIVGNESAVLSARSLISKKSPPESYLFRRFSWN